MSREAMKQALENICAAKLCEFNSMSSRHEMVRLMDNAITALRAALDAPGTDYERGFIDGMQEQMKRSVDRAVRAMSGKCGWVGLTDEDKHHLNDALNLQGRFPVIDAIEAKLKEKNK